LAVDAVPIENGIARVNLNASVALANDAARVALSQQIVWTLRQIPKVQFVEIAVNGAPLSVPGTSSPQSRDSWPDVDPGGLARGSVGYASTGSEVVRLTANGNFAVAGGFGVDNAGVSKLAVSADSREAIAATITGELYWGDLLVGAVPQPLLAGTEAQSIAFDGRTNAWIVNEKGVAQTLLSNGEAFDIEIDGLETGAFVQSVVPSRDGTRAALIVSTETGSVLLIARVDRPSPANATQIRLEKPIRVESKLSVVTGLAWSSANTIALIGSETAGTLQIYEINLGRGDIQAQGSPTDPVSIAAAPGLATLVTSADGSIYENSTGTWIGRISGTATAYPG
jgi:hypothetical protein